MSMGNYLISTTKSDQDGGVTIRMEWWEDGRRTEWADGWEYEEVVLTRKEAKRLKRALKEALK